MGDVVFWGVALAMTLAVTGLMAAALMRPRQGAAAADQDLRVYRDQLKEVDRDLARGLIGDDEAARLRTEIGRRVLAADSAMHEASAANAVGGPGRAILAGMIGLTVLGLGGGVYLWQGEPGYGDLPLSLRFEQAEDRRATRPDQAAAEAQASANLPTAPLSGDPRHIELLDRLRQVMTERPNDLQGQELLARNEAMVGNYAAAARAQAMVVALKGPAATAADLAMQAELLIMAAGGYVSPEAENVLAAALERDASNGSARYYSGLMLLQTGRPDLAFRFWAPLYEGSAPEDPWVDALRAQLPDVAFMAGQHRYQMPALRAAPLPGPDAAALDAARDMTPEQRDQMVRGMVDGLMDRLARDGGTAPEWARLIRALGVLGDMDRARAIHAEALTRFAGRDGDLAEIAAAAAEAGLQ